MIFEATEVQLQSEIVDCKSVVWYIDLTGNYLEFDLPSQCTCWHLNLTIDQFRQNHTHAHDVAPENEIPLKGDIYVCGSLCEFSIALQIPSDTQIAYIRTEYVELDVRGRQKLNPDILSIIDSWSESLSFRELCNTFCGCCGGIALILEQIFHCHPLSAAFRFEIQDGHCEGIFASFLASSPYNIITDFAILLLPILLLT